MNKAVKIAVAGAVMVVCGIIAHRFFPTLVKKELPALDMEPAAPASEGAAE